MRMDYQDKNHSFLFRLKNALMGVVNTIQTENNFRIQLLVSLMVLVAGISLKLSTFEWIIIILCIFIVLALELMNTAVENVVNLVTSEYHPLAKKAKDAAAASVLIFSVATAIIGCIIFLPKILELFR